MITNTLAFGPHVEGVIRIESSTAGDTEGNTKLVFNGSMEVHSRVHEAQDGAERPKHQAHPITNTLMELPANKEAGKIKEIPIRLFFNKAQNALQSRYQAYDMNTALPVCTGDGVNALRRERMELSPGATTKVPCPGPELCDFALSGQVRCRRQVTMAVQIVGQPDPLSVFQLRSSSYYTHKALGAQLALVEKRFGGLRHVPLKLQLWESSTRRSGYEAFDLFKLVLDAASEVEAMASAKASRDAETTSGLATDIDSIFAPTEDEAMNRAADEFELAEPFYPERDGETTGDRPAARKPIGKTVSTDNNLATNLLTATLSVARGASEGASTTHKVAQ